MKSVTIKDSITSPLMKLTSVGRDTLHKLDQPLKELAYVSNHWGPLLNSTTTALTPFIVENGNVVINSAVIGKLNNKTLIQRVGGMMHVFGVGFGVNKEFMEWYGPEKADIEECSRQDALSYKTVHGDAYFGGKLKAGTLSTSETFNFSGNSPSTANTGTLVHQQSRGLNKSIVLSINYRIFSTIQASSRTEARQLREHYLPEASGQIVWRIRRGNQTLKTFTRSSTTEVTPIERVDTVPFHYEFTVRQDFSVNTTFNDASSATGDIEYMVDMMSSSGTFAMGLSGPCSLTIIEEN